VAALALVAPVMRPRLGRAGIAPSPENRHGRGWRGRSWAYFGFPFGATVPTIATTVPTRSAVTSRKFGGSCKGALGVGLPSVRDHQPFKLVDERFCAQNTRRAVSSTSMIAGRQVDG
jgi:hypothetical protein